METACGSRMLEGYRPPYDAAAVERLRPQNMIGVYDVENAGGRTKLTVLRR